MDAKHGRLLTRRNWIKIFVNKIVGRVLGFKEVENSKLIQFHGFNRLSNIDKTI